MFDFGLDSNGEFLMDAETHDISRQMDDDLRTQMALCRIKSIRKGWFSDHIGADLEALLGKPNNVSSRAVGKEKILASLMEGDLYDYGEIFIKAEQESATDVTYQVYLRTLDGLSATSLSVQLDLIKGINVKIGG